METINKKYDLKIEVLTPLSIGAGAEKDWVKGVDFVVNKENLYKLNLKKIVKEGVDINLLTSYFASKNERGIINLITEGKLEKVSDSVIKFPADSPNDIKAFIKNQLTGRPLLAGSSLKGAIRSILFAYLRDGAHDDKQVFGSSVEGDEFMRFIKISDAEFDSTSLVNTKIFNLQKNASWVGGWKHGLKETGDDFRSNGFNTIYECLKPNQSGLASIMLSLSQYDKIDNHLYKKKKREILEKDLTFLFEVINHHTKEYLEKEKAFFEAYSADKKELIIKSIDNLLSLIPSDNSYCILKMSAGSGFHSITGDWQFVDYYDRQFDRKRADKKDLKIAGKILPKSRKIAVWGEDHFDLMGFVKLTAISEEQKEEERLAREALAREHAEKERQLREEQERLEQEIKKREEEFARFYKLAEEANSAGQWPEVLQYVDCAEEIFPERTSRLEYLRNSANANIELQKKQDAIEEAKRVEEEERKKANEIPLVEKIKGASKIPTLLGNAKQWMKQNELEALLESDKVVLKKKLLEVYASLKDRDKKSFNKSFGKDLDSIVGVDIAKQWHEEIVNK